MSTTKINELRSDIDELNELLNQAKRKKVQDVLSVEIRKLETELIARLKFRMVSTTKSFTAPETRSNEIIPINDLILRTHDSKSQPIALKESAKETPMEVSPVPTTSQTPKRYQIKLNGYGWDQSDKYIKVFVTLKNVQNVPKEQVYCKLTERSMELHVENLENKDYVLVINKLLNSINVSESHWKQKTDMVVIFLAKSQPNTKWSHMTEIEKKFEDQRNNRFKTDDDMDKKDPQESIMSLMKNMYETGDDEMKRMISKAWYEGQQKKKTDTLDL